MQKTKDLAVTDREELTLSVPEAARRYFGVGKNAAYAAAARGEIPTIKIGRLLRVPVRALERMWTAPTSQRHDHPLSDAHMLALRRAVRAHATPWPQQ